MRTYTQTEARRHMREGTVTVARMPKSYFIHRLEHGYTVKYIAEELNSSVQNVYRALKKHNLPNHIPVGTRLWGKVEGGKKDVNT